MNGSCEDVPRWLILEPAILQPFRQEWFKTNIEKLEKMYEGTAQLSSIMRAYISIAGVGHVDEAESLFNRYPVPAADATLERLRIYDRLARGIMAMP